MQQAKPDDLEAKPPKTRQKTKTHLPNKQNDTSEDDADFQDKGKDERISGSVSQNTVEDLYYRLKNSKQNNNFKEIDGKIECPICRICIKNIQIHFQRKLECGAQIDMDHFNIAHEEFRKENIKKRKTQLKANNRQKHKTADPEAFRLNHNEEQAKTRKKQKAADPEAFKKNINEEQAKKRKKQKTADPEADVN